MFSRNGEGWMLAEADSHLDWVLTQLRTIEPLSSCAELAWLTRMESCSADASAALPNALESGQIQKGLELAVLMARYWWVLGRRSNGRAWLTVFLDRATFLDQATEVNPTLLEQAQRWLHQLEGADDPE